MPMQPGLRQSWKPSDFTWYSMREDGLEIREQTAILKEVEMRAR
jgi:hypothetical protein